MSHQGNSPKIPIRILHSGLQEYVVSVREKDAQNFVKGIIENGFDYVWESDDHIKTRKFIPPGEIDRVEYAVD